MISTSPDRDHTIMMQHPTRLFDIFVLQGFSIKRCLLSIQEKKC